jgi:hypothetical protein
MPLAQKLARFENLAAVAASGYQLLGLLSRPWPAVLFFLFPFFMESQLQPLLAGLPTYIRLD